MDSPWRSSYVLISSLSSHETKTHVLTPEEDTISVPDFKPNESVSFMVVTEDQVETDRYWSAIVGNGGEESACGWCKDRWGFSWQITPRTLLDALSAGGDEAKRAFEAMMPMRKIDVATIEAARKGG